METLMNEKKKKKGFYPGYSFGMRKPLVKEYASKEEAEYAVGLLATISEYRFNRRSGSGNQTAIAVLSREDLRVKRAELRGFRKLWRVRHSDSFKAGVYSLASSISKYQVSVPVGKCGTTYSQNFHSMEDLASGTLLIWVEKDELGANEFMVSDTNFLIKVPRGHSINDKIQKVKEE